MGTVPVTDQAAATRVCRAESLEGEHQLEKGRVIYKYDDRLIVPYDAINMTDRCHDT